MSSQEKEEIMLSGRRLAEQISDEKEGQLKRWRNDIGELEFSEGWHRYNPNRILCLECDSSDIEWLWDNGEVVGFHCRNCGSEELSF